MDKQNLTKGKWYTNLLNIIIIKVEQRRYFDFKDSYVYRRHILVLDDTIKTLLPILQDVENVLEKDRKEVSTIINTLFDSGRWNSEFLTLRNVIVNHYNKFL